VDNYELTPDDVVQIRRQNTLSRDQTRRLAEWGETIETIAAHLQLLEIAVRESSEDEADGIRALRAQVKRLEELELLRQSGREDSREARRLRTSIKDEHSIEHLQEMLITVTKSLQWAEMKRARAGMNASVETLHEIEEYTAARCEIEAQLDKLKKRRIKK